jgi:hypothetical protein
MGGELTRALATGGGSGEEEARLVQSEEREEGVQERDPVRERVVRLAFATTAATDPEREEDLLAEQARIVTRFFFRRVVPVVISGSSSSSSSSSEEGSGVIGEDTPARKVTFSRICSSAHQKGYGTSGQGTVNLNNDTPRNRYVTLNSLKKSRFSPRLCL